MSRAGLINPDNAAKSAAGSRFQEGHVRVDKSVFRVHHPNVAEGQEDRGAVTVLAWEVTRLNDELEPLTNPETDEPITETLVFGLGGKSLHKIHPGNASTPDDDDEEVEDAGDEDGAEGPTLYLVDPNFKPNEKSACIVLMNSLKAKGFKPELIDKTWAPAFEGMVVFMEPWADEKFLSMKGNDGKERAVSYKVVKRIVTHPGPKSKKAAPPAGKGKPAPKDEPTPKPGKEASGSEAAAIAALKEVAEAKAGKTLGKKAVAVAVTNIMQAEGKVDVKALALVKEEAFLRKHAKAVGYTVDEDGDVTFAGGEETEDE